MWKSDSSPRNQCDSDVDKVLITEKKLSTLFTKIFLMVNYQQKSLSILQYIHGFMHRKFLKKIDKKSQRT